MWFLRFEIDFSDKIWYCVCFSKTEAFQLKFRHCDLQEKQQVKKTLWNELCCWIICAFNQTQICNTVNNNSFHFDWKHKKENKNSSFSFCDVCMKNCNCVGFASPKSVQNNSCAFDCILLNPIEFQLCFLCLFWLSFNSTLCIVNSLRIICIVTKCCLKLYTYSELNIVLNFMWFFCNCILNKCFRICIASRW